MLRERINKAVPVCSIQKKVKTNRAQAKSHF